jgi:hypothetical protein
MADMVSSPKQWALYVYLAANVPDAAVREAAIQNLLQMAMVGSSDEVAVAAQLHHPGQWAYRYVMPERPPGSSSNVLTPVETIPNANAADPDTILAFVQWAAKECPAKQAVLVIWGHGYGLDDYLPPGARPHLPAIPGNLQTQEEEESNQSSLEVLPNWQLGAAVQKCASQLPPEQRLAIVALDACTMAMIEVWGEFSGSAQIGIASQANVPDASFPYDRILARLILEPEAAPARVAQMIVDAYVESYAYQSDAFVTLSACDLSLKKDDPDQSAIGLLFKSVERLAGVLIKAAANQDAREVIFKARNDSPIFDPDGFIDLGRFCEILELTLPDPEAQKACEGVRRELGKFVEYARYSPLNPTLRISQTTGLSVWFPPWLEDPWVEILEKQASIAYLINGYSETRFAQKTGWDKFLDFMWGTRR